MSDENLIVINNQLSIPRHELDFRFTTSGGPGGQHANRSATRVTLLFDVANSPSLDETTRQTLRRRLESRLDQEGILQLHVQDTRSQHQNRELAVFRFQELLAAALKKRKARQRTRPPRAAVEKRLKAKKERGERKRERGRKWQAH